MEPIAINGTEQAADPGSPVAALIDFYRGFNGRDLDLVAATWEQSAEVVMNNPLGGIKRGWAEIESVYRRLFHGQARVRVEFFDYSILAADAMFCAIGRERGQLELGDTLLDLRIRTTRIYRRRNGRWRQVHHHGSMDEPQLLDRYQKAVAAGA